MTRAYAQMANIHIRAANSQTPAQTAQSLQILHCLYTQIAGIDEVLCYILHLYFHQIAAHVVVKSKFTHTVDSKIFARILFSRIALKDIFATLKNRNWSMVTLYQETKE